MKDEAVFVHYPCVDGLFGAFLYSFFNSAAYFYPINYGEKPLPINSSNITFIDFTPSKEQLENIILNAPYEIKSLTIYDHHEAALETFKNIQPLLNGLKEKGAKVKIVYSSSMSGAGLVLEETNLKSKLDSGILIFAQHISNYDVWMHDPKDNSRDATAFISKFIGGDFSASLDNLKKFIEAHFNIYAALALGKIIRLSTENRVIEEALKNRLDRQLIVQGEFFKANLFFGVAHKDVGIVHSYMEKQNENEEVINAFVYPVSINGEIRNKVSLRSNSKKFNCSKYLSMYECGGHAGAAGASFPFNKLPSEFSPELKQDENQ